MDVVEALQASDSPALVTHRHADRDTLGSAIGLQELIGRGTVCTPAGVAGPAQSLLDAFDIDPVTQLADMSHDAVVVLDAPSAERIAPVDPPAPVLIDHHEPSTLASNAMASRIDTAAGATAELIAKLGADAGWEMSPEAALALLVGLLDDTDFLADATPRTVMTAVDLIGALDDRAADLPPLIEWSPGQGERSARAVGVLRASGYRAGDRFVAVTHVGAHESTVATALRDAACDCAVVCSAQGADLRVVARASPGFAEQRSLGGQILPALAEQFGGDGGGHATAGVAELHETSRHEVEAFLITLLESALGVTFSRVE